MLEKTKTLISKKWLISIIILLFAGIFAGCGSDEASSTTDGNQTDETSATEESTESEQTTSEPAQEETEPEVSKDTLYADAAEIDVPFISEDTLSLTDESYNFIAENMILFPAKTEGDINAVYEKANTSITISHLNKNVSPYYSEILTFEGTVISVEEENLENGEVVSITHVMDDNYDSYEVLMYKSTGDILDDDRVRFWGAPVGGYSFENVSGGYTNVQLFVGSHMEKVQ